MVLYVLSADAVILNTTDSDPDPECIVETGSGDVYSFGEVTRGSGGYNTKTCSVPLGSG